MSYCTICNKRFEYATSTLPPDVCPKCYKTYVTFVQIEPDKDELKKQYKEVIELCRQEIKKCEEKIKENLDSIAHFNKLLYPEDYFQCSSCKKYFEQNLIWISKDDKHHLCFDCY